MVKHVTTVAAGDKVLHTTFGLGTVVATSGVGDQARAEQLKATAQSQHARMKELRQAQHQRILALLTPEQRTQWEALKADRDARRGERGKRGKRGESF